jgi:hypothetical protein
VDERDEEEDKDEVVGVVEELVVLAAAELCDDEDDGEHEPRGLGEDDGEVVDVGGPVDGDCGDVGARVGGRDDAGAPGALAERHLERADRHDVGPQGPLEGPLGLPEEHVDGDEEPHEASEGAVVLDGALKGDAEGGGPDAVAGHGEGDEGHGEGGHVAEGARPHVQRDVGVVGRLRLLQDARVPRRPEPQPEGKEAQDRGDDDGLPDGDGDEPRVETVRPGARRHRLAPGEGEPRREAGVERVADGGAAEAEEAEEHYPAEDGEVDDNVHVELDVDHGLDVGGGGVGDGPEDPLDSLHDGVDDVVVDAEGGEVGEGGVGPDAREDGGRPGHGGEHEEAEEDAGEVGEEAVGLVGAAGQRCGGGLGRLGGLPRLAPEEGRAASLVAVVFVVVVVVAARRRPQAHGPLPPPCGAERVGDRDVGRRGREGRVDCEEEPPEELLEDVHVVGGVEGLVREDQRRPAPPREASEAGRDSDAEERGEPRREARKGRVEGRDRLAGGAEEEEGKGGRDGARSQAEEEPGHDTGHGGGGEDVGDLQLGVDIQVGRADEGEAAGESGNVEDDGGEEGEGGVADGATGPQGRAQVRRARIRHKERADRPARAPTVQRGEGGHCFLLFTVDDELVGRGRFGKGKFGDDARGCARAGSRQHRGKSVPRPEAVRATRNAAAASGKSR